MSVSNKYEHIKTGGTSKNYDTEKSGKSFSSYFTDYLRIG